MDIINETITWISVKIANPINGRTYLVKYNFGVAEAAFMDGKWVLRSDLKTEVPEVEYFALVPKCTA